MLLRSSDEMWFWASRVLMLTGLFADIMVMGKARHALLGSMLLLEGSGWSAPAARNAPLC